MARKMKSSEAAENRVRTKRRSGWIAVVEHRLEKIESGTMCVPIMDNICYFSCPHQSVPTKYTRTMNSSLSLRPLVLPVYIQAAECPDWLSSCPWALPMLIHVEGSDVGIIFLRLNAKRVPELKTSSHENSGTRAMEDICPFCNCTSSRNAIHQCVSATCHGESSYCIQYVSLNHPNHTDVFVAKATVSRPWMMNVSAQITEFCIFEGIDMVWATKIWVLRFSYALGLAYMRRTRLPSRSYFRNIWVFWILLIHSELFAISQEQACQVTQYSPVSLIPEKHMC